MDGCRHGRAFSHICSSPFRPRAQPGEGGGFPLSLCHGRLPTLYAFYFLLKTPNISQIKSCATNFLIRESYAKNRTLSHSYKNRTHILLNAHHPRAKPPKNHPLILHTFSYSSSQGSGALEISKSSCFRVLCFYLFVIRYPDFGSCVLDFGFRALAPSCCAK